MGSSFTKCQANAPISLRAMGCFPPEHIFIPQTILPGVVLVVHVELCYLHKALSTVCLTFALSTSQGRPAVGWTPCKTTKPLVTRDTSLMQNNNDLAKSM